MKTENLTGAVVLWLSQSSKRNYISTKLSELSFLGLFQLKSERPIIPENNQQIKNGYGLSKFKKKMCETEDYRSFFFLNVHEILSKDINE